jgi:hypothetical protein
MTDEKIIAAYKLLSSLPPFRDEQEAAAIRAIAKVYDRSEDDVRAVLIADAFNLGAG